MKYAKKKIILATVSTSGVGSLVFAIYKLLVYCKNLLADIESTDKIIIILSFLLFVLLVLVFFLKPIILTIIRWNNYRKMHDKEIDCNTEPNKKTQVRNSLKHTSKELVKELDEIDPEYKEDLGKILNIVDFKGKVK